MAENFPNVAKETGIQLQEAQNPKKDVPKETHNTKRQN